MTRPQLIVGYQIDGYLTHAVYRHPDLLDHADLVGIPLGEIERIRRHIAGEDEWRKLALAASLEHTALLIA